jgi:hypothetical protein
MVKVSASFLRRLENIALGKRGGGKKNGKGRRRRGGQQQKGGAARPASAQDHHALALQRPFNAPVPTGTGGFYSGEQGSITRFYSDAAPATGAAQTCFGIIYHPNSGFVYPFSVTNSTTAFTVATTWNSGYSPGYTFLNASAQKQRSVCAAIRFAIPSLSITTVTGEFAVGVISYDTAINVTSGDQLFTLAAARGQVSKENHEVRWYPGAFDDKYSTVSSTFASTGSDQNDTNAVFMVVRGIPASTALSLQICNMVEWTPKFNTGMAPTMQSSAGTNHQQTVNALHQSDPSWNHTVKQAGERVLDRAVTLGAGYVEKAASKWLPKMFEGGMAAFGL